jgi:hypothetical protein
MSVMIFDYFNFARLLMYMRNTLSQLNLLFPMYWYPTRDLYIVIHLSLLYPCAKSILSPVS